MDWLFLALLTPLLWSLVVLIDDNLLRGVYKSPFVGAIISGFFALLPLSSLLWKDLEPTSMGLALLGIASGILTVLYYLFYFKALENESPSVVIALFSLSPVSLPFLAYLITGERLVAQQVIGFCIVLLFTLLLTATDVRKLKFSKALVPVAIGVVFLDVLLVASKYMYDRVDFYSGFMFFSMGMGMGAAALLVVAVATKQLESSSSLFTKRTLMGGTFLFLAMAEFINITAEFSSNLAISKGPVSLVEVLQNTQPMYMLLIALLLFPFFPKYFREAQEGRVRFKLLMMLGIIGGVAITIVA